MCEGVRVNESERDVDKENELEWENERDTLLVCD